MSEVKARKPFCEVLLKHIQKQCQKYVPGVTYIHDFVKPLIVFEELIIETDLDKDDVYTLRKGLTELLNVIDSEVVLIHIRIMLAAIPSVSEAKDTITSAYLKYFAGRYDTKTGKLDKD